MSKKTEISLRNFYIFNSKLGPREGDEEKKILFYHPPEIDIDTKIKDVGLSEAIIKFTSTFTSDDSCQSFHTQKTCQLYYQPELDFWMIMTVNVPYEVKSKEGIEYNEYKGDDVHDSIFRAVLEQSYKMFRLFMGTFEENFTGDSIDKKAFCLMLKLQHFFPRYLLTLKLQSSDILDIFNSIQYLPLNQILFLRVHNFLNMIESTFPTIKHCIFLYNEQVVWSGINPTDLFSIYEYLTGTLFPRTTQSELRGGSISRQYSLNTPHYGSFITGPDENIENCVTAPKVFIYNSNGKKRYYLAVYRALSATICLLLDDTKTINDDLYNELHSFIGPQLTTIASEIGETFTLTSNTKSTNESSSDVNGPKFLYFNEFNLRHDGSIYSDNKKLRNANIPHDVMNLIADLYDDRDVKNICEETVVKTLNDYWIVRRSSNARHFFVIINKSSTLTEITEEANKMYDQHIKNVFFDK